jgi:transcriptional regulator with XRE-family HTH domain
MPIRESAASRGRRRAQNLLARIAAEIGDARRRAGLSQREVGRRLGIDHRRIAAAERADPNVLSIDLVARIAPVVGLQLSASLHPEGDPVRDKGHLALIRRFLLRLGDSVTARLEVPMPIVGDRRSADIVLTSPAGLDGIAEAETTPR